MSDYMRALYDIEALRAGLSTLRAREAKLVEALKYAEDRLAMIGKPRADDEPDDTEITDDVLVILRAALSDRGGA